MTIEQTKNTKDEIGEFYPDIYYKTLFNQIKDGIKKQFEKILTINNLRGKYSSNELKIAEPLIESIINSSNPIVIYDKEGSPLFWNKNMEDITGYTFDSIKSHYENGGDIMQLLYGYSEKEIKKVIDYLSGDNSYENVVFTLKTKSGETIPLAWTTEITECFTVRRGSKDTKDILEGFYYFVEKTGRNIGEKMKEKDEYTTKHIERVGDLLLILLKYQNLNKFDLHKAKVDALVHDIGKLTIPDYILQKPSKLTEEEFKIINSHVIEGIKLGLEIGFENHLEGMCHHSKFYSKRGNPELSFDGLLEKVKAGEEIDPMIFNKLMGNKIPERGRHVMIADIIDAMSSRRLYDHERAALDIDEIYNIIISELKKGAGLFMGDNGNMIFDTDYWSEAGENDFDNICLVEHNGIKYIPKGDKDIFFDPLIIIELFKNKNYLNELKNFIFKKDEELINFKITEFEKFIKLERTKKQLHEEKQNNQGQIKEEKKTDDNSIVSTIEELYNNIGEEGKKELDYVKKEVIALIKNYQKENTEEIDSIDFTDEDEKNLKKMEDNYAKIINIKIDELNLKLENNNLNNQEKIEIKEKIKNLIGIKLENTIYYLDYYRKKVNTIEDSKNKIKKLEKEIIKLNSLLKNYQEK